MCFIKFETKFGALNTFKIQQSNVKIDTTVHNQEYIYTMAILNVS